MIEGQPWDANGRTRNTCLSTHLGRYIFTFTFANFRQILSFLDLWYYPLSSCCYTSTPHDLEVNSEKMSTETATAGTTGVGGANAAAVFKRLHPVSYLLRFLSSGYRPDGRPIVSSSSSLPTASASAADDIWREVSINAGSISTAHGSALVRMGDTTMVCGVKAEIGEPDTETPGEGFVGESFTAFLRFLFLREIILT